MLVALSLSSPVAAQDDAGTDDTPGGAGFVNVIEVSGLLDPVLARFVEGAIDDAEASGAMHLVLQV
ncbi:MAG: hypothetical protein OES57_14980, partial [Acidimicrobiia bacterium]|nr:hypothetical protein [Acidimicrobiia bacterium]